MFSWNQGEYGYEKFTYQAQEMQQVVKVDQTDEEEEIPLVQDVEQGRPQIVEYTVAYEAVYSKFTDAEGEAELRFGMNSGGAAVLHVGGETYVSQSKLKEHTKEELAILMHNKINPKKKRIDNNIANLPQPFLKLHPGVVAEFFPDNAEAKEAVESFYKRQDVLLEYKRRRDANLNAITSYSALYLFSNGYFNPVSDFLVKHLWQDGYLLRYIKMENDTIRGLAPIIPFLVVSLISNLALTALIQRTRLGGALEYYYNQATTVVRSSMYDWLGDKAYYIPQLDSVVRGVLSYSTPSIFKEDDFISQSLSIFESASSPYREKSQLDKSYGFEDERDNRVRADIEACLGKAYQYVPSFKMVSAFQTNYFYCDCLLKHSDYGSIVYKIPAAVLATYLSSPNGYNELELQQARTV